MSWVVGYVLARKRLERYIKENKYGIYYQPPGTTQKRYYAFAVIPSLLPYIYNEVRVFGAPPIIYFENLDVMKSKGLIIDKDLVLKAIDEDYNLTDLPIRFTSNVIYKHDGSKMQLLNDNLNVVKTNEEVLEIDLLPEGAQKGLAADSTGVKYDQPIKHYLDPEMFSKADEIYIEYGKGSSAGDETTRLHIYCITCGKDVLTDDQTGAVARKRVDASTLKDHKGHEIKIQFEVVTASGTSGATTDLYFVRLLIKCRF